MGLFDLFSSANGEANARAGYNMQKKALKKGFEQGTEAQNTGYDLSQGFLGQALQPFQNLGNAGMEGVNYYGNLYGLNGQEAASQAFQGSPGYQFSLAQGLQALDRNHAAGGSYNSGNWGTDAMTFAQGLASQDYYKQLAAGLPYFGLAGQGAAGESGVYGSMSNVAQNRANALTNLASGNATQMAQAGYDLYGNINNAQTAASQAPWNLALGLANAAASAYGA